MMSLASPRRISVALLASVSSICGAAHLNAAASVDGHMQGLSTACNTVDGKGFYEKYGEPPFQWTSYCTDNKQDGSSLKCAGAKKDYLCLATNIGIKSATVTPDADASLLQNDFKQRKNVSFIESGLHEDHPDGVAVSGCSWAPDKENVVLTELYGRKLKLLPDSDTSTCTAHAHRKGHYIVMSIVDHWNPFEGMHQPLMAFATIAKLGLSPDETNLVYVGTSPPSTCTSCKMLDFLERTLSRGGPALQLDQGSLCLENAIFPIPGAQSFFLQNIGMDDPTAAKCSPSPVVLGFAEYVKDAFAVSQPEAGAPRKLRITIASRTPSPEHPDSYHREMANADELEAGLESGESGLVATNATQKAPRLRSALWGWNSFESLFLVEEAAESAEHSMMVQLASHLRGGGEFEVREVVPPSLSMQDQIDVFSNTDLLIAPHGASLTWQILQPECSQAIEFCTGADFHFVNIAHYAGKKHTCLSGPAGWGASDFYVDVPETLAKVKEIEKEWRSCRGQKS